jgi:hypothetical protein
MTQAITTRAKEDLLYTHEYGDGKKKKKVTLRLVASPKGIVPWLAPDAETGRVPRPGPDTFDDFLELVVHPDDALAFAEAIEADTFGEAARFDAAMSAWKNSMGERDFLSIAARIVKMTEQAEELDLAISTATGDPEPGAEEPNPLGD